MDSQRRLSIVRIEPINLLFDRRDKPRREMRSNSVSTGAILPRCDLRGRQCN